MTEFIYELMIIGIATIVVFIIVAIKEKTKK
jgi:hypothetical protein